MKGFTFFVCLMAIYGLYIIFPSDDYTRIQHACAPVNAFGKPIQSGERLATNKEAQTTGWFAKREHDCQLFVYDLFYKEHEDEIAARAALEKGKAQ